MEKKILAALYFFLFSYVSGVPVDEFFRAISVENCGKTIFSSNSPDRIVGGQDALPGKYPWMGSLKEDGGWGFDHVCGCTVVNPNWIVTAAHCIDFRNSPWRYRVHLGMHKLSNPYASTVQEIKIEKIILHEGYDDESSDNDIALLKTSTPIDIKGSNGYVNAACLPKSTADPTGNVIVTGWGHTVEDGENSDTLQEVTVPMVSRRECNAAYRGGITENMICAGSDYKDSCQSDSGGPLIQLDNRGIGTFIGVVSFGIGCGEPGYPGVYAKVSRYMSWMEKHMST